MVGVARFASQGSCWRGKIVLLPSSPSWSVLRCSSSALEWNGSSSMEGGEHASYPFRQQSPAGIGDFIGVPHVQHRFVSND